MRILFDLFFAQPIGSSKFHGGGEYMKTVFKHLVEMNTGAEILVYYDFDKFIDEWIKELIQQKNIKTVNVKSIKEVERIFKEEKIDTFYSGMPYKYYEISMPQEVRKIGTFHGLRFAEKPSDKYALYYYKGKEKCKFLLKYVFNDYFQKKATSYYKNGINTFDDVVTVSEHTKYAIRAICNGESNKKIDVFYTPAKFVSDIKDSAPEISNPYILLMGGNRWEKNVCRALTAIESLLDKGWIENYKIVVIGKLPQKIKEKQRHQDRYILQGYVETEKLENLYKYCDVFLYPSLNEGFGMPPLEAMKYGKTCIVSAVCSLPEVCGDGVYYVNPYDIREIENRILHAVDVKIPSERVYESFKKTYDKQTEDLALLCSFITKG